MSNRMPSSEIIAGLRAKTDAPLEWLAADRIAELNTEVARLRDVNQVLFEERTEAWRRESRQRLRAETAENELAALRWAAR